MQHPSVRSKICKISKGNCCGKKWCPLNQAATKTTWKIKNVQVLINLAIWFDKRWDSASCFLVSVTCSTFTAHMSPPFSKRWIVNLYNHLRSYIKNSWKETKVACLFLLEGAYCTLLLNATDPIHGLNHSVNKPNVPSRKPYTKARSSIPTYLFHGQVSWLVPRVRISLTSLSVPVSCLQPR